MPARCYCASLPISRALRSRAALAGYVAAALALSLLSEPDAASAISPNGTQFQVNTYTTSDQQFPAITSDPSGNFVVVWESYGDAGSDGFVFSVQGQRYNANGSPLGGQLDRKSVV